LLIFLGNNILLYFYACSILGMLMILAGLYLFLWGKRKELVPPGEETLKKQMQFQSGDESKKYISNI
jgi:hypothetical protein